MDVQRVDGTRLRGRIDLLVDTPAGWIRFDHKSNPRGASADEMLAQEDGPQLAAYANALLRATGQPVMEQHPPSLLGSQSPSQLTVAFPAFGARMGVPAHDPEPTSVSLNSPPRSGRSDPNRCP